MDLSKIKATKKTILVISGFFITLFLCYKFAFSKTLDYRKNYHILKKEVQLFETIPDRLALLTRKEKYYDSIQHLFRIKETSLPHNILKTINKASKQYNFKVIDFNDPHIFNVGKLRKNSYRFTVEGNFMNVLKLIHYLEQKTKFGEIIHCHFENKKTHSHPKGKLYVYIIIQNVG